jgi:hypothetical protein
MTIEAATAAEIFLAYLDHVLCPALRPGDVVVMDNLSSHKVAGVRPLEPSCSTCLLTPPTSTQSRKHGPSSSSFSVPPKARTAEALEEALAQLLPDIRPQDAQAWLRTPFHAL